MPLLTSAECTRGSKMRKTAAQIANTVIFKLAQGPRIATSPAQPADVASIVPRQGTLAADYLGGLERPRTQRPAPQPAPARRPVNWNAPGAQSAAGRPSQALIDRWNRQYLARHPGAKMPAARPVAPAPAVASRQPVALPKGVYGAPEGGTRTPPVAAPKPAAKPAAPAGGIDWEAQARRAQAAQAAGGRSVMLPPAAPRTPTKYGPAHDPSWYRNALRPYESTYSAPTSGYNPADYEGLPTRETSPGIQRAMDEKQKVEELAARRRDARRGTISRAF
jgi:hypothetical protein